MADLETLIGRSALISAMLGHARPNDPGGDSYRAAGKALDARILATTTAGVLWKLEELANLLDVEDVSDYIRDLCESVIRDIAEIQAGAAAEPAVERRAAA